ncbi:MAG: ABC transporter permease [Gemmatimonadaceae bacterium]
MSNRNAFAERYFAQLTRLFPRAFREAFGDEIRTQVSNDYAHAKCRGAFAALWFVTTESIDITRAALAEHRNPTWIAPYNPLAEHNRMPTLFENWIREIRHAARSLKRSPGFTFVTVLTLGLAIGANAGMFSVVNRVLFHPLPYANIDRMMYVAASAPGSDLPPEFGVSSEFYLQYKEQSKLLEDIASYNSFTATFRANDRIERIRMSMPSSSLFSTLGAKPLLGRLPNIEDSEKTVVLSYALWTSWFNRDSSVIGKTVFAAAGNGTVIAVMPPDFRFPEDGTQLWVSSEIRAAGISPGRFGMKLVGRVKRRTTPELLATELTAISKGLPERFGGSANYKRTIERHRAVVRPITEQLLGAVSKPLKVLLGAVAVVLLIACANVVNLFNVRAEGRQRDLAVRRALGAARGQLIRLQIAEAIVVALLAGALAMLLAYVSLPALLRAAPAGIPRIDDVRIDGPTLFFTIVAAIVSALACGIGPAIRTSAPELSRLREGGRGATRGHRWVRDSLVAAQSALALVLLIGSGLLMRSFWELKHVNPGYSTKDVFTFQIAPDGVNLKDGPSFGQFSLDFMDRLRALPGVQSVGLVENVPLNESTATTNFRKEGMADADNAGPLLNYTFSAGDYFKTMSIRLISGRTFTNEEQVKYGASVVLSKSAAKKMFPGEDALGKRVQRGGTKSWETVVGVVDDVLQDDFRQAPEPVVYFPMVGAEPGTIVIASPAYVVKTARAQTIAPDIRKLVREVAPSAPMYRVFTMEGLAADSMVQLSFTMLTLGIAAGLALILGAVGLYGVLSYIVAERTREIGVRMALGARAAQVRTMVVAQGARVVGAGVVVGMLVAIASTRLLGSLLFGVAPLDVMTFVVMAGSMIAVGLLASYVPARRASNVDPIESLRSE